jgi:putative pyruvate formate lyase activating enzyme
VASYAPHFGEEPPLTGLHGSGTVFFSHCNLGCLFCQNADISHLGEGVEIADERLADIFLYIERLGCHNLNLVTPTHSLPMILSALAHASERGFELPVVYNTGGYDTPEALQLLDGVVDIYMPDIKSFDPDFCRKYLQAPDYPEVVKKAVRIMAEQTGDFITDDRGIGRKGLLIRHLVMPGQEQDSLEILNFINNELPVRPLVNIMDQYHPCYRSGEFEQLNHRTPRHTFQKVYEAAAHMGLSLCA